MERAVLLAEEEIIKAKQFPQWYLQPADKMLLEEVTQFLKRFPPFQFLDDSLLKNSCRQSFFGILFPRARSS